MSIPDDTPAAVITLPSSTTRSPTGVAPNPLRVSRYAQWVVARSPSRIPAAPSTSAPVHTELVNRVPSCADRSHASTGSSRSRGRSLAAGHQDHVGRGDLGDRATRLEPEPVGVGPDGPGLGRHEVELGAGEAGGDLVGADRVERRQAIKEQNCDPHDHHRPPDVLAHLAFDFGRDDLSGDSASPASPVARPIRFASG